MKLLSRPPQCEPKNGNLFKNYDFKSKSFIPKAKSIIAKALYLLLEPSWMQNELISISKKSFLMPYLSVFGEF